MISDFLDNLQILQTEVQTELVRSKLNVGKLMLRHTNITDDNFVTFGVKGLLQASKNIRNALLFNVLSYMSEQLLTKGNTVASVDEFYLCAATRCRIYTKSYCNSPKKVIP